MAGWLEGNKRKYGGGKSLRGGGRCGMGQPM